MSLNLTPELLAAAYDYLSLTEPFSKWNLPESEEIVFKINKSKKHQGWYQWDKLNKKHGISCSQAGIAYSGTLMCVMAHEMIHLYLEKMGWESRSGSADTHNDAFKKFAARVCKIHGFDPKSFY